MKYGYARVSTDGQSVDDQVRQLTFRKVRRPVFPLDPHLQWNYPA